MKIQKYLKRAKVPEELWEEAQKSIDLAEQRKKGLLWFKLKVRLFKARTISEILPWDAERLVFLRPDLADNDIEPMTNITSQGDNGPWVDTPEGGRPVRNYYLNQDPLSQEYKEAVASNYWCKGSHPRSKKSRKAWYRRNAGAHRAYMLGEKVLPEQYSAPWNSDGVVIHRNNGVWEVIASDKFLGFIPVTVRIGFEIDNVFSGIYAQQAWYPIEGYELKAPVTWSVLPSFID